MLSQSLSCYPLCVFAADMLREGDELLEVNGMPIWDKTTDHLVTLMVSPAIVFIILMYVELEENT